MTHHGWNGGPRPVAGKEPSPLEPGQERRWLTAIARETRTQALARARATMPWGLTVVGAPTLARGRWVFAITTEAT